MTSGVLLSLRSKGIYRLQEFNVLLGFKENHEAIFTYFLVLTQMCVKSSKILTRMS